MNQETNRPLKTYDVAELAQTLFEEAGDALFLFEPNTEQVLDTNPMAQRLSGFARQDMLRMPITYLFRSEATGGLQRLRQAYRKTGLFHSQEGFLLRHFNDGTWIPVNLSVTRLHTEGDTLGLITARDLREQREAESRLRAKDAELRRLLASVSDCIWSLVYNSSGQLTHLYCSPAIEKITGRKAESFSTKGSNWFGLIHAEDRQSLSRAISGAQQGQAVGAQEYRIFHADGGVRWVRDKITVSRGPDGSTRLDGILSDITEQKKAQLALEESQRLLQKELAKLDGILKSTPVAMGLVDRQLRYVIVNERLAAANGRPVADHIGRTIYDILPADLAAWVEPKLQQVLSTGVPTEKEWRGPSAAQPDQIRDWIISYFPHKLPDGTIDGAFSVIQDVTERYQAQEQVRQSEKKYRNLVETSHDLIWAVDAQGRCTYINPQGARQTLGYAAEDIIGRPFWDFIPPGLGEEEIAGFRKVLSGQASLNHESSFVHRDGRRGFLLVNSLPLYDDQGNVVGVTGTAMDITQRKLAENALRASEAKYRTLLENLKQSVVLKDRDFRYVAANPNFWHSLGCHSEAEVLGKTDFDFYPSHIAQKYRSGDQKVLAEGKILETQEQNPQRGDMRIVRTLKSPVTDETGQIIGVLAIFWDISDQLALEAQLRQAQKMDAIGQLAGGVAHDFNNLLTVILGNLTFAMAQMPGDSPLRLLLEYAEKAAQRGAQLTQQLLGFSRRSMLHTEPLDLNRLVEETVNLLRRIIDPRIQLEVRPSANLWPVMADSSQINQVLMNLCLNARDAMPQGGQLVLETAAFVPDEDYLRLHMEARGGEFVRLRVQDTGHGIPPEVRQRIFEPFFTTKETGKGTGLGLAMVFGIIKQHQGWIECNSVVNQGTCFDIYLPRAVQATPAAAKPATTPAQATGHETILLVDDEPLLRNLGKSILQQYGYKVLLANNGRQAIELYERQGPNIDLVILDATMPVMSGRDALNELVKLNPDIHILYSSGFSAEHHQLTEVKQVRGFINKPYRMDALAIKVREILDLKKGKAQ